MNARRRNLRNGLIFCSPAIVGLAVFTVYPVLASLYYSFCNYTVLKPATFVGLANYRALIADKFFYQSLYNTLYYAVLSVPLGMVTAFLLAVLLNAKVRGLAFFRTIFYLPSIVPVVASSVLWLWLLNPDSGMVNAIIDAIGRMLGIPLQGPGWMQSPEWSKPSLVLMSTWGAGGWMVIFLAGLQDVPREMYEAAAIDGAGRGGMLWHVTVPFMGRHIVFVTVMGLIGASQFFAPAYVMTGGSGEPAGSTLFYSLYLFQQAFSYFQMGYACALAWVLFAVIFVGTLLFFKATGRFAEATGEG
ncbi:MAG: spermidine/putrescine ABC transporter permease [Armatimonadota bacterium]|nr:MAG: spermidine/putrescine ABC transporter permease [Armatimonadota bacterium]